MSKVLSKTFRAEVVGSMLRPDELNEARARLMAGAISPAEFKVVEDRAVDDAIALQERLGLDVVCDGEMRRVTFLGSLSECVNGITPGPAWQMTWHDESGDSGMTLPLQISDRVTPRRSLATEEFAYARARSTKPVKVTLPSPMMLAYLWNPEVSPKVYPDPMELFHDAAAIVRAEVEALIELGCEYVQIDAPDLALLALEGAHREEFERMTKLPAEQILDQSADILDGLVSGLGNATFGLHVCRGNSQSTWLTTGSYDAIVERVLKRTASYDTYLLEYDDLERDGGFDALAALPQDKVIVLGLISTKVPEMETHEQLVEQIEDAARYYPRDQLALSPQCGFASSAIGNNVTVDDQERKLRLVADVAHEVWG